MESEILIYLKENGGADKFISIQHLIKELPEHMQIELLEGMYIKGFIKAEDNGATDILSGDTTIDWHAILTFKGYQATIPPDPIKPVGYKKDHNK
jgi:hypothetical protein